MGPTHNYDPCGELQASIAHDQARDVPHYALKLQPVLINIYNRYTALVQFISDQHKGENVARVQRWCPNRVTNLKTEVSYQLSALHGSSNQLTADTIRNRINQICNLQQISMAVISAEGEIYLKRGTTDAKSSDIYLEYAYSIDVGKPAEGVIDKVNADLQVLESEVVRRQQNPHGMPKANVVAERIQKITDLKSAAFAAIQTDNIYVINSELYELHRQMLAFYFDIRMNL